MRRERVVLLVVLVCLTVPSTAAAQERAGFWGGFGAGWGSAQVEATRLAEQDRTNSGVGYFNLGWTLDENLLLGAEFNFWRKSTELSEGVDANFNIYNVSGTLTFYPGDAGRFFLKGGAGASYLNADYDVSGTNIQVDFGSGFGFIIGAGYDIPLTSAISLTPAVNLWYGQLGDLQYGNTILFTDWKQNVFDLTIGLKFH